MKITEAQREVIRQRLGQLDKNEMSYVLGYILWDNEEIVLEALTSLNGR